MSVEKDEFGVKAKSPVLVVDDSRAHRRLLTRTLAKWGYDSVEADSGEAALELCQSRDIDVVISDWMMPGMSGVEFCRELRRLSPDRHAYFILLTAQSEKDALVEGLESGADDFLAKPFNSVELRARLRAGERVVNAQRGLAEKNRALGQALDRLSDAYSAIDRDLREARKFQEALVPDRHVEVGPANLTMLYRPSGHVGGDLVGYFPINETEIGFYSVDVSGHGVASALMTARVASYFSAEAPERNIALTERAEGVFEMLPLDEVFDRLNRLLQSDGESDQYLTMAIAHFDTGTGIATLCLGGHPSPLVLRSDGSAEFLPFLGMPIGLVESPQFGTGRTRLHRGDRLILYSDGVTECQDPAGNLLDEDGLAMLMQGHAVLRGPALMETLVDGLERWADGEEFSDDVSAVMLEWS